MGINRCPVCDTLLETRDVAPCMDCGGFPHEIEEALAGRHTYAEMRVIGVPLVLCDFCQVDFGSYDRSVFGLPPKARIGYEAMEFVRSVPVHIGKDKWCPECQRRLAFLKFVQQVIRRHRED